MTKRRRGDRRWGLSTDFPLVDCDGVHVLCDRRSGRDRRQMTGKSEELLALFPELPTTIPVLLLSED